MKKVLKIITLVILAITLLIVLAVTARSLHKKLLYTRVDNYAKAEYELLNIPNELKDQEEVNLYTNDCHYDYKVRSMRCGTRRTKYFVVENSPFDEYSKIDEYLVSLGWKHQSNIEPTVEESERLKELGYLPKKFYSKGEVYELRLFLQFLGDKDYRDTPYFDSGNKTNQLLEKYYMEGKTLYRISISTDFVN